MDRKTVVLNRLLTITAALLLTAAALVGSAGSASAVPTADFTFSPTQPTVRQPVTFRWTGTCDVEPCSFSWAWFPPDNSGNGTSMGPPGPTVTYAFADAGLYHVRVRVTNGTSTHGQAPPVTKTVVVRDTVQDTDREVGYNAWRGVSDIRASVGGFRNAVASTSVAAFPFTGTAVTYVARTGPNLGIAAVSVDGVSRNVDLYQATRGTKSVLVDGLTAAAHRVQVRATGTKNPASSGTGVTVDEFVVGASRFDDRSTSIVYDRWTGAVSTRASGGSVRNSSTAGAATTFAFDGPSVTWLTFRGPGQGRSAVFIDGTRVATVDGYAPAPTWQVPQAFGDLGTGHHTIRVVVLGQHNAASTGNRVTSDAFVLR
jgi:hypothetical protein